MPYDKEEFYETFGDRLSHLEEQANGIEEILPQKLDLAQDLQQVLGTSEARPKRYGNPMEKQWKSSEQSPRHASEAAQFSPARHFVQGVLRSKEEHRFSLRRCRKEDEGPSKWSSLALFSSLSELVVRLSRWHRMKGWPFSGVLRRPGLWLPAPHDAAHQDSGRQFRG